MKKNFKTSFLITLLTLLSHQNVTKAEYRVYQYYITQTKSRPNDSNGYTLISTLDPVSYHTYHGGELSITADLLNSWMCYGYTGNMQEPCPNPYEKYSFDSATKTGQQ